MQPALLSLIAASLAFVGLHFAFSHPLRSALLGRLGENGFRGLYSLTALGTFIWMILAYRAVGPEKLRCGAEWAMFPGPSPPLSC